MDHNPLQHGCVCFSSSRISKRLEHNIFSSVENTQTYFWRWTLITNVQFHQYPIIPADQLQHGPYRRGLKSKLTNDPSFNQCFLSAISKGVLKIKRETSLSDSVHNLVSYHSDDFKLIPVRALGSQNPNKNHSIIRTPTQWERKRAQGKQGRELSTV